MSKKNPQEVDADLKPDTSLAEAEVALLKNQYSKTLSEFCHAPATVSLSRAAHAMYRLGRIRQCLAISAAVRGARAPNPSGLRSGVLESLAGTHAMVVHRKHWCGTHYNKTNLSDLALQVAMLIALGWRDLATFVLHDWFGDETQLDTIYHPTLSGVGGMIVSVAGQALGVEVPQATFRPSDAPLASMAQHWRGDETAFIELAVQLADRHLAQSHGHGPDVLAEFDHPIEQAVPVELLMLLRLREHAYVPRWLAVHPAMAHPAATLLTLSPPVLSQRCELFCERTARLLPGFEALSAAIAAQRTPLRSNAGG